MKTLTALNGVLMTTLVMLGTCAGTAWAGINEWTSVGPEGGLVQALAIDPQNPGTVYAATLFNVFKSTDGAASWTKTALTRSANNLAIDPRNSGTVYAVTAPGLSKTTDGGATWSDASSVLPDRPVLLLLIDPQNSSTLYALTSFVGHSMLLPGPIFPPTIFKSTDGGITWNPASSGLAPGNYTLTLAIDPRNSGTLYAGTSSVPFPRNAGSGLFRSTDGGASWSVSDAGIPDCCVFDLAIDPRDSKSLYAAWAPVGGVGGIVRSTDGGTTWTDQGSDLPRVNTLAVDPQNAATLYGTTFMGLFVKSINGGTNWNPANLKGRVQTFALDPQNPATVYAATAPNSGFAGGGVFKTTDGGSSWSPAASGIRAIPVRNVAIDPQHSGTLYAASGGKVLKTTDGGAHWTAGAIDARRVTIDPRDPDTVFALVNSELQPAKSTDGGVSWKPLNLPLAADDFVTDLVIDPQDSGVVYAGTVGVGVIKSTDAGESWSPANSGLPQEGVVALAISGGQPTMVYASVANCDDSGCLGDGIFKSADGGLSWISANSGLPGSFVFPIAVDPQNPATLYVGLSQRVFKSIDGGASWKQLSFGPADAAYFSSLAVDPRDQGTVYAGTGTGVFRSTDGGENWSAVNWGLPEIGVSSLTIDPQDPGGVYAATEAGLFVITFVP